MRFKIVARAKNLRLKKSSTTYRMTGGKYGDHYLHELFYNERVNLHWKGYIENNGIKWHGHPEYFPLKKIPAAATGGPNPTNQM